MRAHYRNPVQDVNGGIQPGSTIAIYQNGTSILFSGTVWADGESQTTLTNPWITPDGNINFYLDSPQRVDLGITIPGSVQVIFPDIDVEISAVSTLQLTFPGSGQNSTAIGASTSATAANAVAVGDSSSATAAGALAVGQSASGSGPNGTALGSSSSSPGAQGTAVGSQAQAGPLGVAVGYQASSVSSPSGGTAVGQGASVGGQNSTALGEAASASGTHSTAVGAGATAAGNNEIVLGTSADAVITPGAVYPTPPSSTQVLGNGSTITIGNNDVVRITMTGNVTGIILPPGPLAPLGQEVTIINESAFSATFAAAGTSNEAGGTADNIPALRAPIFTWDPYAILWYRN